MRLESDETASLRAAPQCRQLFEEPIPNTDALDFDSRHGAGLLARLLVIAKVRHQEERTSGRHRHARGAAETREIPDVGPRRDEQRVESFCLEESSQCSMAFRTPIGT